MPHILIGIVGGAQPCSYTGLAGTLQNGPQSGTCPWVLFIAGE
jgi:hypothetical protein